MEDLPKLRFFQHNGIATIGPIELRKKELRASESDLFLLGNSSIENNRIKPGLSREKTIFSRFSCLCNKLLNL